MAEPRPENTDDGSYPYLLPLESSDDEEVHTTEAVHKKQKLQSEKGETSSWEVSLKFEEWLKKDGIFHCGICLSDLPKNEKFPMKRCIHQFCNSCISTYVTIMVRENDIPIKCPILDCKFSFLQLDMCRDILTEEIVNKWGILMEDSTFGLPTDDENNNQNFHGTSEADDLLLMKLAHRNNWKSCPKCNIFIEKVDGCRMVKCRNMMLRQRIEEHARSTKNPS